MLESPVRRAKQNVKAVLDYSPTMKSLAYVADDMLWGWKRRLGGIQSDSGSTHRSLSTEESVTYVEEVFQDYKRYGGLDRLSGVAAEVGPGDNAGVALLLRAAGCDTVELVDRFRSRRDPEQQRCIYRALAARHRIPDVRWDDGHLPGVTWRTGISAEEHFAYQASQHRNGCYDLIVSRAVLEHLYDPLRALRAMTACLKPGGRMLHKIDFRDHGMFTPAQSELTFYRSPTWLHRQMTQRSGRPNRILLHQYRELAKELSSDDLDVTILITSLIGEDEEIVPHVTYPQLPPTALQRAVARVDAEHHRISREFAGMDPGDLAVTGIFWVSVRRS